MRMSLTGSPAEQYSFAMPEPARRVEIDDPDWFLYRRAQDEKWEIIYRPYQIPQGPVFDSEAEAYKWYIDNREELNRKG